MDPRRMNQCTFNVQSSTCGQNFLIAKALGLRRAVFPLLYMKALRILAVCPLFVASVLIAAPVMQDAVLPETVLSDLGLILQQAVQQSPRMLNRVLDLQIAENDRIQARSGLLPSVGGYASYFQTRDTRADLSGRVNVTKIAYNFSINQPLYYWGERANTSRIGQIQSSIAAGQFRDGYRQLAQTLRGDYMRLIVQKAALKRADFYLQCANNQLAQDELRLAKKVISDAQIYGVRLAAEQSQISRDRAQFEYDNAKVSFARLSGSAVLADAAIPDVIPAVSYDGPAFDRLLAGFLNQKELPTNEAYAMRQRVEIEKLNYANAKTRLRPKFNAVLGISQDEQSYTINVAQKYKVNSYFGGVSINWSIFDGLAAGAAERSTLTRKRQAENDYRTLTEQLSQQAQTQVKMLSFAARSMSIADRALIASEGNLRARRDEFARGVISEADVNQSRIALYDATLNAFNYRSEFLFRVGEFLGTLAEDPVLANLPAKL